MKNIAIILLLVFCFNSCKSSKGIVTKKTKPLISKAVEVEVKADPDVPVSTIKEYIVSDPVSPIENYNSKTDIIINYAKQFDGVSYKYGGTTKNGMDCSGLVCTAFKSEAILLPRSSKDMAGVGNWIEVNQVEKGDLLFFATKRNSREINHVGLVTEVRPGFIEFIHSTIGAGVIVSNLAERYWHSTFVQARRVL
ncbi:C40 family peptidase [Flavobacteriaceae bacterium LMO-SS05]